MLSIISIGLICALLTGMVSANETILPTRTQTDYDVSYPLNITPVVNPNSVCFLPLESPESLLPALDFNGSLRGIGTLSNSDLPDGEAGGDEILINVNTDVLQIYAEISLKSSFSESNFHLNIHRDNEILYDGTFDNTDKFIVRDLQFDELYNITCSYETNDSYIEYVGYFFYGINVGNQVFIALEYDKSETPKVSPNYFMSQNEYESNNSMSTANLFRGPKPIQGSISDSTDVDWFYQPDVSAACKRVDVSIKNQESSASLLHDLLQNQCRNSI